MLQHLQALLGKHLYGNIWKLSGRCSCCTFCYLHLLQDGAQHEQPTHLWQVLCVLCLLAGSVRGENTGFDSALGAWQQLPGEGTMCTAVQRSGSRA